MSTFNLKPYLVSGDIIPLLRNWAERKEFNLPDLGFFRKLQEQFTRYMKTIFPSFEFIPENELTEGLKQLVMENKLHPLSLDRVYYQTNPSLEVTRLVVENGEDKGVGRRSGALSLLQQFKSLRSIGVWEIALVDDVIFTGSLLERVVHQLLRMGFSIPIICVGVGISEGTERLELKGHKVYCVRKYKEVIDEVCERDFYPGIPLSGRSLVGSENIGLPYLLPFGNPGKWASIPQEWQVPLSKFCIKQTIELFEEIERCSNRSVSCSELGRSVITLPRDGIRFVDALHLIL